MQRYAIIKNGVVLNVVEYEEQPIGTPAGFEQGVIAIRSDAASPNWVYVDDVFTDPNPIIWAFPNEGAAQ